MSQVLFLKLSATIVQGSAKPNIIRSVCYYSSMIRIVNFQTSDNLSATIVPPSPPLPYTGKLSNLKYTWSTNNGKQIFLTFGERHLEKTI